MRLTTTLTRWLVGLTGVTQVLLGLAFWTGHALGFVSLHMAIGLVFVLALWMLAGLAARAGVQPALVALGVLWGILVLALGISQGRLLPGRAHWVVQAAHLLVGVAAMALAARLTARIRERVGRTPPPRGADDRLIDLAADGG